MVTLTLAILSNRLAKPATLLSSVAFLLVSVASADAQGHRAHLSADLQKHLDAGDGASSSVILSGTSEQIAALAARHSLRIRRLLAGGAVVDVPAGGLDALASDADVPQISGDHVTRGQMSVTDTAIGADQVWAGIDIGTGSAGAGFSRPLTGRNVGVALLDSGVTIVAELRGQVRARVDMIDPRGTGADAWGHGTHIAGIIAGAGTVESNGRGVAPGAHLVSVKVLGADGSGHISDVIAGIDWVIANRQRYQIDVINLSLGSLPQQSWRDDPVCQAIERAWRVGIVSVAAAGNNGKDANGQEVLGAITSPGNCPYAITAGAVNTKGTPFRSDDVMTTYSSRGPTADGLLKPDLLAPGNKIRGLLAPGAAIAQQYPEKVVGNRLELSGTSMSSAIVAGAVALLRDGNQKLNPETIRALLQLGAERLPDLGIIQQGAGSLNVLASVAIAATGERKS
jgi:serine protease AprX